MRPKKSISFSWIDGGRGPSPASPRVEPTAAPVAEAVKDGQSVPPEPAREGRAAPEVNVGNTVFDAQSRWLADQLHALRAEGRAQTPADAERCAIFLRIAGVELCKAGLKASVPDEEVRRIAAELDLLHKGGGFPNLQDAGRLVCSLCDARKVAPGGYEALIAAIFASRGVKASEEAVRDAAQRCRLEHEATPFNSALDIADWSVYAHGFPQNAAGGAESPMKPTDCSNAAKPDSDIGKVASLALDLETYSDLKSKDGALSPHTGHIRLFSLANESGEIQTLDLNVGPLPQAVLDALAASELVIHNAAFEMRWLTAKFGILPRRVFCTLSASRLLTPKDGVSQKLGPVIERHMGIKLTKDQGGSDWGSMFLSPEQLTYAADDVRYLLPLLDKLEAALTEAKLTPVFELEMHLLPIVTAMETHGFPVDTARMRGMRAGAQTKANAIGSEIRAALGQPMPAAI